MTDQTTEGCVYAIGHPHGYVKIGRSNNPKHRLRSIQTSSPYELWIIVQLPVKDSCQVESDLHDEFSERHVRGEWFELSPDEYDLLVDMVQMANSTQDFETLAEFKKYRAKSRQQVWG